LDDGPNALLEEQGCSARAADIYGPENVNRMRRGLAPQRYNESKGGLESMELSHEPIPLRDGGRSLVERWPCEHALVDPYRKPGYC
jgi:filamentous hemagglutinin